MEFRPAATTEVNYNLNYLNVPLMIQFKSDGGFYGEAGPYVGFLLSGKYKQNVSGVKSESDIKDYFKSTDLGAALGIGYMMKSGFGIGARYNMGLSNIYDASSLELKNRFWQLNLLYTFNNTANHAGAKDKAKKAAKGKM